jgi:Sec-independent protein translocase protein TatA
VSDSVSLSELFEKTVEILRRDINHLFGESCGKKLSPTSARDLAGYLKILKDLQTDEASLLANLSDEKLEKLEKDTAREARARSNKKRTEEAQIAKPSTPNSFGFSIQKTK